MLFEEIRCLLLRQSLFEVSFKFLDHLGHFHLMVDEVLDVQLGQGLRRHFELLLTAFLHEML